MDFIKILSSLALFNNIDTPMLERISGLCQLLTLRRGETLFVHGEFGDAIYILVSGELELSVVSKKGQVFVAERVGAGAILGLMTFVDQGNRGATATNNTEQTHVLKLDAQDFYALCEEFSDFGFLMMTRIARIFSKRIRERDFDLSDA